MGRPSAIQLFVVLTVTLTNASCNLPNSTQEGACPLHLPSDWHVCWLAADSTKPSLQLKVTMAPEQSVTLPLAGADGQGQLSEGE